MNQERLLHGELLKLKRWNTPTIYNGWEQITQHDRRTQFNLAETRDYMPNMGVMVGYAVTVVCEPANPEHIRSHPENLRQYREYIASVSGPKIVIVQDLDKPHVYGSFWGEVNANVHRALGCVGTITDGAVRDVDEMCNAGFKALASRMCVGHAYSWPVRWNCEVEVFGCPVQPGQLIHADKHGFMAIPAEDELGLLAAAKRMDANECATIIAASRATAGKSMREVLAALEAASADFEMAVQQQFNKDGSTEW